MRLPRRFNLLGPYLASFLHSRFPRPPVGEVVRWMVQPDKAKRARRFVAERRNGDEFIEVDFRGHERTFYYPVGASWVDLCQTIDEVFNPANWHQFVSDEVPLGADDVVVDCGAAEGLFSFVAGSVASRVYAVEPVPSWHGSLRRTFAQFDNVELLEVGVGHRDTTMRMSDEEIYSRVTSGGSLEIPVRTLDSLFPGGARPVTFIKADIEGFEFQMLLGAEELIRRDRPKISLTVYHPQNNFYEIREFLENIHADYRFRIRGLAENGNPVLLQAY